MITSARTTRCGSSTPSSRAGSDRSGFVRAAGKADGAAGLRAGRSAEALHLRLSEPGAVEPAAGSREPPQHRGDLAVADLKPDFKTIADFRRDNRGAFKPVFRQFVLLCRRLDLFGRELLAVDGTRIKAVNNKDRNFTRASLREFIRAADERLDDYLERLDEGDVEEGENGWRARQEPGREDRSAPREARPLPSDAGAARADRRGPDLADRSRQPRHGRAYAGRASATTFRSRSTPSTS